MVVHIRKGEWAKAGDLSKTALAKKLRFRVPSANESSYSDDLQVVIRQLGERGYDAMAKKANTIVNGQP